MPKSKPSEVEIVAMALAWQPNDDDKTPQEQWRVTETMFRDAYLRTARAFLRALRSGPDEGRPPLVAIVERATAAARKARGR